MYGSGYPTYPNFLHPSLKFFSPFWSNFSSEKLEGQECILKDFFFDLNPIALRKAKIVYYFGLSECNRVTRKTIVLSKDIKIIFFCNIFLFFFNFQK